MSDCQPCGTIFVERTLLKKSYGPQPEKKAPSKERGRKIIFGAGG